MPDWKAIPTPRCQLAESPRFAHGRWVWLDIHGRKLFLTQDENLLNLAPETLLVHELPDEIACVLPTADKSRWVLLGRQGTWIYQEGEPLVHLHAPPFHPDTHRFNDGRADAEGRIWISSLVDARQPATAALYCIENGKTRLRIPKLIVGNGLAFSPDNTRLFLADTRHKCIWAYDFNLNTGELGKRQLVKEYTDGTARPDGAAFTQDGSYWVAVYEGYRLDRFSLHGEFMESVDLPVARPTMPCFGGTSTLLVCAAPGDATFPNHAGFETASLVACETPWCGVSEHSANICAEHPDSPG